MKSLGFFLIGMTLLASLVMACGGGDTTGNEDGAGPGSVSGGMVARNQFMTYDGHRYELVNMIFEGMIPSEELQAAGTATESDVDLTGDMRVFTRAGDTTVVYTHSAATADDNGFWLAWRLAS